jgi:hypothetical protein
MSRDGWSIKQRKAQRMPLPDWYLNPPEPVPFEGFFLDAFDCLSTERPLAPGGFMGPIPWSKIAQYADSKGLDQHTLPVFQYLIRAMDEGYLSLEIERQQKEVKARQADEKRTAEKTKKGKKWQ